MLGYAKLLKNRIFAQGATKEREEIYQELEQGEKEGKTWQDVLAARNTEKKLPRKPAAIETQSNSLRPLIRKVLPRKPAAIETISRHGGDVW